MSLIRRISTSITSSVDRAVSKVENHDAIIDAALRDTQQAAARSRVRLERVRKDGRNLKSRHADLQLAVSRWTERAKSIAADDESKALGGLLHQLRTQFADVVTRGVAPPPPAPGG